MADIKHITKIKQGNDGWWSAGCHTCPWVQGPGTYNDALDYAREHELTTRTVNVSEPPRFAVEWSADALETEAQRLRILAGSTGYRYTPTLDKAIHFEEAAAYLRSRL